MARVRVILSTITTLLLLVIGSSLITSGRNVLTEAHAATGPDFGMASSASSLIITLGSSGTVTITVTSLNSFSGSISLSVEVSPPGLTSSLAPQTVTLTPGASQTSTLTVSTIGASPFNSIGSYMINVTGITNGGTLTHSIMVAMTVSSSAGLEGVFSLVAVGVLGLVIVLVVYFARRKLVKS